MICNVIDKDFYLLKIYNDINNFDIYDYDSIKLLIKDLFSIFLKKYNITGNILFNIFIDSFYGMIIEIKKISDFIIDKVIDIKIKFNLNISFLYEVDYFYLIENNILNQNVYYYDNKFYLEIINDINNSDYIKLLDNSVIIYNEYINDIVNKGIKLTNIKNVCYNVIGG